MLAAISWVALSGGVNPLLGAPPHEVAVPPIVAEVAQPVLLVVLAGLVGRAVAELPWRQLPILVGAVSLTWLTSFAFWLLRYPWAALHPFMSPYYEEPTAAQGIVIGRLIAWLRPGGR